MTTSYLFKGPGTLQLSPAGQTYAPGDPVGLSGAQLRSLRRAGLRFDEPVAAAKDEPKQAEQPAKGKEIPANP